MTWLDLLFVAVCSTILWIAWSILSSRTPGGRPRCARCGRPADLVEPAGRGAVQFLCASCALGGDALPSWAPPRVGEEGGHGRR